MWSQVVKYCSEFGLTQITSSVSLKYNDSAIADAYTGITQKWGKGKVPKLIS